MFANLKKKIESEVGDLSRLTPNLRSVTQSDKMTPLSSRHGSVSSLASETSYTNKLASPLSPIDSQQMFGGPGARSDSGTASTSGGGIGRADNQRVKRQYEEKLQNQELDFAWRLNSKDEEITKLQKQVDHLNNMLQSKEFETQQKLVRVQEDMDSLEGFSQQENAKIKHLLLNREEELSQLRATVMIRDSTISEFEGQMKNIKMENDRLKKSLDEIVSRRLDEHEERVKSLQNKLDHLSGVEKEKETLVVKLSAAEEKIQNLQKLENLATSLGKERNSLENALEEKSSIISSLENQIKVLQVEKESALETLRSENTTALNEERKVNLELRSKIDELASAQVVSGLNQEKDEQIQRLLQQREEELRQLRATVMMRESTVSEVEEQMKSIKLEKERLQKSFDDTVNAASQRLSEQKELVKNLQQKLENLSAVVKEKEDLVLKLSAAEEKIQNLQKLDSLATSLGKERNALETTLEKKSSVIATLEKQIQVLQDEKESAVKSLKNENSSALEKMEKVNSELQSKLDELAQVKIEKEELVLQVKNIQVENEQLKKSLDETVSSVSSRSNETEERVKSLQSQLNKLSKVEEEKETLVVKLSSAEEKIQSMQNNMSIISTLENQIKVLQDEKELALQTLKNENQTAQDAMNKVNTELRSRLNELVRVDVEKNELVLQVKNFQVENERLKNSLDETASRRSHEHEERVKSLQNQIENLKKVEIEKDALIQKLSAAEERIQNLEKLEDLSTVLSNERNSLESALEEKSSIISTLESQIKVLQDEKELALESLKNENLSALDEERKANLELRSKLDEAAHVEVENSELVLQISEIQSKCDELEEENNFLKSSANSDESDALKRKVSELEADLLDRNQMLKQQSHQLQDLRRSLAKEINKNQAIAEGASASSLDTNPQCNGSTSQQQQQTVVNSCPSTSEPPTLPPQETDVNFMYLRSVIFKFLTTTDVQVTQQLTRVVATLLHLSEEETHLLSQATESRNGWISNLIIKS